MKYVILGSINYANRRLVHEFKLKGQEATILDPVNILSFVNDKRDDRIYIQGFTETPQRLYKKNLKGIVPRIGKDLQFHAKTVEHINKNIGVPSTATATALLNAQDKFLTTQLLSQAGVKTPKTFAVKKTDNPKWIVEMLGGFPIVAKINYGSQGVGVFILTEELSASTALSTFTALGHNLILQEFVETAKDDTRKHDYRAFVVDGKVVAAIKRNSTNGDFRTNTSIQEDCEGVELDEDMKVIAIKAAEAVGLSVAGVDLARHYESKEIYCYELNGNANWKSTERYSKKNVAKTIVEYMMTLTGEKEETNEQMKWGKEFIKDIYLPSIEGLPFGDETAEDTSDEMGAKVVNIKFEKSRYDMGIKSIFDPHIQEKENQNNLAKQIGRFAI